MKYFWLLLSLNAFAQTATIKWKDVATPEVVQLQPCGGQALCLSVHNPGKSDPWGQGYIPQPKFFESVDATVPGYGVLTAELQDVQHSLLTGVTSLVRLSQYKYAHKRSGNDYTHPAYIPSGAFHMLDGGDRLYFRFVPLADPFELQMLGQITQAQKDKAAQILNINDARVAQWPLLAKFLNLYKVNMTHFYNPNITDANRDMGWLIRPENFATRWWGAASNGGIQAMKHWYGFGTKAAAEGFSNEHYNHAAWWIASGLRNNDQVALNMGLYLLRYKIAYGLVDSDAPGGVWNKIWRNEKSNLNRGTAGTAPSSAKSWDLDVVLGNVLLPSDPLIARGFQVRSDFLKTAGFQWNGGGGARILGRHLHNLLDFYHATGDVAFKQKAEAEIVHAFSMAVNGNRLWFREYTHDHPSCGEGGIVLPSVMKWVHQEGALPGYVFPAGHALAGQTLVQHLNNMRDWYLTYCGMWQKSAPTVADPGDLWKPGYNCTGATATSCNVVYNSNSQGFFWTGLIPFMSPAQQAQGQAILKKAYTSMDPLMGSSPGSLGPSAEKWIPMGAESARN